MKKFFLGILTVLLLLVLVAGYLGFVPGLSSLFGSDKPVDLGVTYTSADSASGMAKGKVQHIDIAPGGKPDQSLSFSGQMPANFNLTQSEATALANGNSWIYFPLSDIQIRFNADKTAEISAVLKLDKLKDYAAARGVSESDFNEVVSKLSLYTVIQKEMPYYVKGTGSVVNGVISFECLDFKLGRLPVPVDQINSRKTELLNLLQSDVLSIPGFSVNNFSILDGQMHFDGTLPVVVGRVANP